MGLIKRQNMIRLALKSLKSTKNVQLARYFSETLPQQGGAGGKGGDAVRYYKNGELVKRSFLTLKTSEDIEGYVVNLWRDYHRSTNKADIGMESGIEHHGLDSLDSIELSMRIEEDLGVLISAETLPVLRKVKHYVNYLNQVQAFQTEYNRKHMA